MRDIDKYTKDYMVENFEDWQIIYRRKKVLSILSRYSPKRILEIGCGMEPLFKHLNDEDYSEYTVVEPSVTFYENAVSISKDNPKIECINALFSSSDQLKSKNFDFIICSSLLHEIADTHVFLSEIHKICSKDTVVHINVPNANSFHRQLAKYMGLISDTHEQSERNLLYQQSHVFDLTSLPPQVEKAGFRVVESGSYFIKPFTHGQMFSLLTEKIIDERVLDGLYEMGEHIEGLGSEIFVNLSLKE